MKREFTEQELDLIYSSISSETTLEDFENYFSENDLSKSEKQSLIERRFEILYSLLNIDDSGSFKDLIMEQYKSFSRRLSVKYQLNFDPSIR